jgi:hypothetical protein
MVRDFGATPASIRESYLFYQCGWIMGTINHSFEIFHAFIFERKEAVLRPVCFMMCQILVFSCSNSYQWTQRKPSYRKMGLPKQQGFCKAASKFALDPGFWALHHRNFYRLWIVCMTVRCRSWSDAIVGDDGQRLMYGVGFLNLYFHHSRSLYFRD